MTRQAMESMQQAAEAAPAEAPAQQTNGAAAP